MLAGVQKINGNTKQRPGENYPPAAKRQIMRIAQTDNYAKMTSKLEKAIERSDLVFNAFNSLGCKILRVENVSSKGRSPFTITFLR